MRFDHEKLDVYQVGLESVALAESFEHEHARKWGLYQAERSIERGDGTVPIFRVSRETLL